MHTARTTYLVLALAGWMSACQVQVTPEPKRPRGSATAGPATTRPSATPTGLIAAQLPSPTPMPSTTCVPGVGALRVTVSRPDKTPWVGVAVHVTRLMSSHGGGPAACNPRTGGLVHTDAQGVALIENLGPGLPFKLSTNPAVPSADYVQGEIKVGETVDLALTVEAVPDGVHGEEFGLVGEVATLPAGYDKAIALDSQAELDQWLAVLVASNGAALTFKPQPVDFTKYRAVAMYKAPEFVCNADWHFVGRDDAVRDVARHGAGEPACGAPAGLGLTGHRWKLFGVPRADTSLERAAMPFADLPMK